MNIFFISGSLDPGKDGVGDYTLMMAAKCNEAGAQSQILALNDAYLNSESETGIINNIPVLRLRAGLSWAKKKTLSSGFIEKYNPVFVCIQMVGYAYQPRGWIFGLGNNIKSLFKKSVRFEVNLHEVWLGFSLNHDLKASINGFFQRVSLLNFLDSLKPEKIHVGNNVYYSLMFSKGYSVNYLPLPSNIDINDKPDFSWIYSETGIKPEDRNNVYVALFFGSIQGNWDITAFWDKMLSLAGTKKFYVLSVGRQGFGNVIWDEMERKYNHVMSFKKLGFRTNSEISELLQFSDYGIGTTPLSLTGKSGTAMAMIEHGLPVIVTRDELKYKFPVSHIEDKYPRIVMWDQVKSLEEHTRTKKDYDRTSRIARMLIDDLTL